MQCARCQKTIGEGDYIEASGKLMHVDCFTCEKCCRPIGTAKYMTHAGNPYHPECLAVSQGNMCFGCGKPLTGSIMDALGKTWHPECFRCGGCHTTIQTLQFNAIGDVPYHSHCYQGAMAKNTPTPSGPSGGQNFGGPVGGDTCWKCRQPIGTSTLTALDRKWHPDCFQCGGCNAPIRQPQFAVQGDVPFHPECQNAARNMPQGPGAGQNYGGPASGDTCWKCRLPISGSALTALDRKWHPDCFQCGGCNAPIRQPQFAVQGDVPFHPECQNSGEVCSKCSRPVGSSVMTALGKKWHPDCFVCRQCQRPIGTGQFAVEGGEPYHPPCAQAIERCGSCSQPLGTSIMTALGKKWHPECFKCGKCGAQIRATQFAVDGGVPIHPECVNAGGPSAGGPTPTGDVCCSCNKPLTTSIMTALGKKWHPDCFVCGGCRQPIRTVQFAVKGDVPYHPECNVSGEVCSGCNKPMTSTVMTALGKKWHPDCFVCIQCRAPIRTMQFAVDGGMPLHPECGQARTRGGGGGTCPNNANNSAASGGSSYAPGNYSGGAGAATTTTGLSGGSSYTPGSYSSAGKPATTTTTSTTTTTGSTYSSSYSSATDPTKPFSSLGGGGVSSSSYSFSSSGPSKFSASANFEPSKFSSTYSDPTKPGGSSYSSSYTSTFSSTGPFSSSTPEIGKYSSTSFSSSSSASTFSKPGAYTSSYTSQYSNTLPGPTGPTTFTSTPTSYTSNPTSYTQSSVTKSYTKM